MNKCGECGRPTENTEQVSDNGGPPDVYCDDCGGFPAHEYTVTCPNCDLTILVN